VFNEEQYGVYIVSIARDTFSDVCRHLENSTYSAERDFARYVEALEENLDHKAFVCSSIKDEKGVFTAHGYLAEQSGEFATTYNGPDDIPDEFKIVL
jgi:hypothetical protein